MMMKMDDLQRILLADISVRAPQNISAFTIYTLFSGSKYPKNILFNLEHRSTGDVTDVSAGAQTLGGASV